MPWRAEEHFGLETPGQGPKGSSLCVWLRASEERLCHPVNLSSIREILFLVPTKLSTLWVQSTICSGSMRTNKAILTLSFQPQVMRLPVASTD